MENLSVYIPIDRRRAIANEEDLPDRVVGSMLFADISGFTPLTEALLQEYGPKRGAEELTQQLNHIYDALVTEVHASGGSILSFSGDAITCWFKGDEGTWATICASAMQEKMTQAYIQTPSGQTISMGMKIGIAAGSVRRFQVGNPNLQYFDALAGATLDRMIRAEQLAEQGEILLAQEVAHYVKPIFQFIAWRRDLSTGEKFAVLKRNPSLHTQADTAGDWLMAPVEGLTEAQTRPWILPPIYEGLQVSGSQFLAELRPSVVLFLYFNGIRYDDDELAEKKLALYIEWVQETLAQYEAYILQLTIGDKGSYLYTAFGAPIAHEDDAIRAVSAALELKNLPSELDFIETVKMGISQGMVYSGAYGGRMRRTYGVLGDEVNLAARLMQIAKPGQILVKDSAWQATLDSFTGEALPPFKVKGKSDQVLAYHVQGWKKKQAVPLRETNYAFPLIGRKSELELIFHKMSQVLEGEGQIVAIQGQAGLGKSRLVAEVIQMAGAMRLQSYGGSCHSYGTNTSYLVWQPIWQAFFELSLTENINSHIQTLKRQLRSIDEKLIPRLPLLGPAINIPIPDNELTRTFEAKLRKESLAALLVDCLRSRAKETPLMLILEDCHWLDPLSHDLLEIIGRAIVDMPVMLLLVYRPLRLERLQEARLETLPYFTEVELSDFSEKEAKQLIKLKLAQLFGDIPPLSSAFIEKIIDRAQGNPFYIEELLNYLKSKNIDLFKLQEPEQLDLPSSLQSLILSRIDQLTEHQKMTLKVASVIGRLFEASWIWGMYPQLGSSDQVRANLQALARLDVTPMDAPEPELAYFFKHIVTQEVAYESLPYAMREVLHEKLGQYIEEKYAGYLEQYINLLALHYSRSGNEVKKRQYLRQAGEIAQANYANEVAINYYQQALSLLRVEEQIIVLRKLGEVYQLVGQWDEARKTYTQALKLVEDLDDLAGLAWCHVDLAELLRYQGQYDEASDYLDKAQTVFETLSDQIGFGRVLHLKGTLAAQQGHLETAQTLWQQSLAIRREIGDLPQVASLLNNLAIIAEYEGDYEQSRSLHEEALSLRWQVGDRLMIADSLNNLGNLALAQGNYDEARSQMEVAVELRREVGDRWRIANSLNNLGNVARDQGDYRTAQTLYAESLSTNKDLGDRWAIAYLLEDIGILAALEEEYERALRLVGAAHTLREKINSPLPPAELEKLERFIKPVRKAMGSDLSQNIERKGQALSLEEALAEALQT